MGWLHPHPRKRGDILSRLDLVSPAFRADASIGKVKSTTTSLPAMLWPIYGREKSAETLATSPLLSCSGGLYRRGPAGRVQCSFCRELAHEEPSFCRELAHEEPTREKSVEFLGMACSLLFLSPFHFRRGRSPTAAQFASWPAVRPKLPRPVSSLGRPDSNTAARFAAFS